MKQSKFPTNWDEEQIRRVLTHYEGQTEEDAVAEDKGAFVDQSQAIMEISKELVPAVRKLIEKHQSYAKTAPDKILNRKPPE